MWETDEERRARLAASAYIVKRAVDTAVAAEIEMTSPDCQNRQYEAGKIDACVAILKVIRPEIDWLADIRMAAIVEKSAL